MSATQALAVDCRDVVKGFGSGEARVMALRGVTLQVNTGEMTLLVGPSGCGKTTLISAIAGMLTPDSGGIRVFGEDLERMSRRKLTAFRAGTVGFVFQQFNLLPALTCVENASIPLRVLGRPAGEANRRAAELLDRLGMAQHRDRFPGDLSGGQQQRVAIARALVHDPRLVVCDEPTASLDAANGQAAMALLRELAMKDGRAVIVVTHDERIYRFADRIAHMADGHIENVSDLETTAA
jgi:putative ABC transport system ATP-binding protein